MVWKMGGKVRWWGYSLCVFIVSRMMEVGVEGFFVSSFSYGRVTATVSTQTGRERDDGLMAGWTSIHEYTPQYHSTVIQDVCFRVFCFLFSSAGRSYVRCGCYNYEVESVQLTLFYFSCIL